MSINIDMKTTIRCFTLFDITKTNILNRRVPVNMPEEKRHDWELDRNRQSNFDTIIQAISLRTQPEDITEPVSIPITISENKFGFLFDESEEQLCWHFDFTIYYKNAYADEVNELGGLYSDCADIPMNKTGTEWDKLPNFLDTSPELRNIYFEVLSHE